MLSSTHYHCVCHEHIHCISFCTVQCIFDFVLNSCTLKYLILIGHYAREYACILHTINLQGVCLEKLLVAVCMAGVVAHMCSGHLGNVQWSIISEILLKIHKTTITVTLKSERSQHTSANNSPGLKMPEWTPIINVSFECINLKIKKCECNQAPIYWTAERKESSFQWNCSVT